LERSTVKSEFKRVKRQGNTALNLVILSTDQYLTHYWPFENGSMKDAIGSADMMLGSSTSFVSDIFGNVNSALALNGGWTQAPPGVYFDTPEFTISVWVNPSNVGGSSRIIDFGNGSPNDNIIFVLSLYTTLKPRLEIYSQLNIKVSLLSPQNVSLNEWQFLAATFNGTNARVYLNGRLTIQANVQDYTLIPLTRSKCYVGKSNFQNGYSESYLDDLKFYNKSLTLEEINQSMNRIEISKIIYLRNGFLIAIKNFFFSKIIAILQLIILD